MRKGGRKKGDFKSQSMPEGVLLVDIEGLKRLLQCGARTARNIGDLADAKVKIGHNARWDVAKIKAYINNVSGKGGTE